MRFIFSQLALAFFSIASLAESEISDGAIHVVLGGDHADPTITRDGEDFYLTYSSYSKYPGLKIWHSTNLVDWEPISYALHEDLGAIWAPDFIKHGELFYIYFPTSKGKNYVTTAKDPRGPWSKPVLLEVNGIDPGHIADPDGNRYIYLNDGKFATLSRDGLSVTSDAEKKHSGWQYPIDWDVECFCLESPKLMYRNGWYYLTSAQGGTAGPPTSHMVVNARSRHPEGPWEESPRNPIVHTYSREEAFWSKGHGTIFDDANGNWYVIYHGYQNGQQPFGRHILIEAIEETADGWFKAKRNPQIEAPIILHKNEDIRDDTFEAPQLGLQWQLTGLTNPYDSYKTGNGSFTFEAKPDRLQTLQVNPAEKEYEIRIELGERDPGVEIGLGIWYSDEHLTGISLKDDKLLFRGRPQVPLNLDVDASTIHHLSVRLQDQSVTLYYSQNGETWMKHPRSFERSGYHTNVLGGFSYLRPAIYTQGMGQAEIKSFQYNPL